MKLKRLLVLILIIFFVISFKFSDTLYLLGIDARAISLQVSFNSLDADTEVRSVEEFKAVLINGIKEVKEHIKVRAVNYNEKEYDVNTILNMILSENAELGFVSGCNIQLKRTIYNETADIDISMRYYYPREIVVSMREDTQITADRIINNIIKPEMNEYERVLAVHDYLVKNSTYDKLNANKNTVPPLLQYQQE